MGRQHVFHQGDRNVRHEEANEVRTDRRTRSRSVQEFRRVRRGGIQARINSAQIQGTDGGGSGADDAVPVLHRDSRQNGEEGGSSRGGAGRSHFDRSGASGRRRDDPRHAHVGMMLTEGRSSLRHSALTCCAFFCTSRSSWASGDPTAEGGIHKSPLGKYFVNYEGRGSDWYLKLAGAATQMIRG